MTQPEPIAIPAKAYVIENPYRGAEVEAWLKKRGARYLRCVMLPIELFDERTSRKNQARAEAIVTEAVDRYTVMFRSGKTPPPLVAYKPGKDLRFVIVDGNNREASGKKAGVTHLPTFILAPDTPTEIIQLLTVEANAGSSEPVALSWRLRQAADLMENGFKEELAAEVACVTVAQLRHHRSLLGTDDRARSLKIHGFTSLADTTRHKLGQIKSDPVLRQAARVAFETEMTGDDTKTLVRDVKAAHSEAEAFSVIAQVEEDRKAVQAQKKALNNQRGTIRNVTGSLTSGMGKVIKTDIGALLRNMPVTEIERQRLWNKLKECADKLLDIQAAVEPYVTDEEVAN